MPSRRSSCWWPLDYERQTSHPCCEVTVCLRSCVDGPNLWIAHYDALQRFVGDAHNMMAMAMSALWSANTPDRFSRDRTDEQINDVIVQLANIGLARLRGAPWTALDLPGSNVITSLFYIEGVGSVRNERRIAVEYAKYVAQYCQERSVIDNCPYVLESWLAFRSILGMLAFLSAEKRQGIQGGRLLRLDGDHAVRRRVGEFFDLYA